MQTFAVKMDVDFGGPFLHEERANTIRANASANICGGVVLIRKGHGKVNGKDNVCQGVKGLRKGRTQREVGIRAGLSDAQRV